MNTMRTLVRVTVVLSAMAIAPAQAQDDVAELTAMVEDFLANADQRAAHERFWAEDLVYSSSSGLRFGKADIMQGFDSADDQASGEPTALRRYGRCCIQARGYADKRLRAAVLLQYGHVPETRRRLEGGSLAGDPHSGRERRLSQTCAKCAVKWRRNCGALVIFMPAMVSRRSQTRPIASMT